MSSQRPNMDAPIPDSPELIMGKYALPILARMNG